MLVKYFPEPELSKRLSKGDESAFREVINRFHGTIFQFAFSFLKDKDQADEIVQDTFLSFWLHRKTLHAQKPIAPFLFTIARRKLTDAWRKEATSKSFRQRIYENSKLSHNDTEEKVLVNDLDRVVGNVLEQLTEQQQQVFTLSRYEELSYDEIAERLQISKNTVKYHLVNVLKVMRSHFTKHDVM